MAMPNWLNLAHAVRRDIEKLVKRGPTEKEARAEKAARAAAKKEQK